MTTTEEIGFGATGPDSDANDESPRSVPQPPAATWQAPVVLLVFLLVVGIAAGAGIFLGRTEDDSLATRPILTPQVAWVELTTALANPAAPGADATPDEVLEAIRAYSESILVSNSDLHRALENSDGPYSFIGFPADAPSQDSLEDIVDSVDGYVDAIDDALDATDDCIGDGKSVETCVVDNLQNNTEDLQKASAGLETSFNAVAAQANGAQPAN